MTAGPLVRRWRPERALDLPAVLGPMRRGPGDPTFRYVPGAGLWRATRTPAGPATTAIRVDAALGDVEARAWGPGAAWSLETLPDLLGESDDPAGFAPVHPVLREAWRGFRTLLRRHGEPAPGPIDQVPAGLRVPPAGRTWAGVPSWEWHQAGVDQARSRTVVVAAGSAGRLEALGGLEPDDAATRLRSLPGVGAWTAAEVAQRALGDADAVSVGDYHLSSLVGQALVGEPVDDDAMLELLEPYRGHRYRAVRLVELSGVRPERHGPRYAGRDYRAM